MILLILTFTVSPASSVEVIETADFVEEVYIHSSHHLAIEAKGGGEEPAVFCPRQSLLHWEEPLTHFGSFRSKLYLWHRSLILFE